MTWIEEVDQQTIEQVKSAGNHIVAIPAMDAGKKLDTFDIFDNRNHKFIGRDISQSNANIVVTICNNLIDSNVDIDIKQILWLIGK
jgi:hypothetical protein